MGSTCFIYYSQFVRADATIPYSSPINQVLRGQDSMDLAGCREKCINEATCQYFCYISFEPLDTSGGLNDHPGAELYERACFQDLASGLTQTSVPEVTSTPESTLTPEGTLEITTTPVVSSTPSSTFSPAGICGQAIVLISSNGYSVDNLSGDFTPCREKCISDPNCGYLITYLDGCYLFSPQRNPSAGFYDLDGVELYERSCFV